MEAQTYTDTILLQASRKSSAEYLAGNNETPNSWTNDLGQGVRLDIGDTISVSSAYISEIGNEDSTIEIKGRKAKNNLGENQEYTTKTVTLKKTEGEKDNGSTDYNLQTSDGNYGWDYTQSTDNHTITDDAIFLTHSYYKCVQGDNYISLPRSCGQSDRKAWWEGAKVWAEYNSSLNGKVESPNPYRLGTDYSRVDYYGVESGYGYNMEENNGRDDSVGDWTTYSQRTELSNDGRRYTLFVRKNFKNYVPEGEKNGFYLQGERDPAMMDFIWYKKTVKYEVTNGFNSPANVASQITNTMTDTFDVKNTSYGEDNASIDTDGQIKQNNLNLVAQSNMYELFPCSTAWFIKHASELWFNDSYDNDIIVPLAGNAHAAYEAPEYVNALELVFEGVYDSKTYVPESYWTDGHVYVGWKFKEAVNTSNGSLITEASALKGAEINAIREVNYQAGSGSDAIDERATFIKFNKEAPLGISFPKPTAGNVVALKFTNEHIPILYESCYSTVGYLRPEIQEYGRAFNAGFDDGDNLSTDKSFITQTMTYPMTTHNPLPNQTSYPSTIRTYIPWTDDNLTKIKNLLEAQALYPELFNWDKMSASQQALINVTETTKNNVSPDKMRFLHMNDKTQDGDIGENKTINGSITEVWFGEYITVNNITDLKKGMRLYKSDADTADTPLYPRDTYITSIRGTSVYVSNPHNDIPYAIDGSQSVYFAQNGLGSDRYTNASNVVTYDQTAGAVFFDYNPARKDILEGEGDSPDPYETLTYGFARKVTYFNNDYIGFYVGKYQEGTLPEVWFDGNDEITGRCIGFDKHFNAYGTNAILLTNGYASLWGCDYNASNLEGATQFESRYQGIDFPEPNSTVGTLFRSFHSQPDFDGWFFMDEDHRQFAPNADTPTYARLFNEIYCGANQPSLQFDSLSSRFSFTNLHTSELIGTNAQNILDGVAIGDASDTCFKLNKRISRLNYSPNFIPYNNVFKIGDKTQYNGSSTLPEKDNNITPYAIFDAQGGIFIEDYGCDEANWSQSLWELMGFTYEQLHNVGSRLNRFNDREITTSTPTTNALIKSEDLRNLATAGLSGIPTFNTLEVPYPFWRYNIDGSTTGNVDFRKKTLIDYEAFPGQQHYPAITQGQVTSTSIVAKNLPRKMLSPIYLIKSDLLNPMYVGGRDGSSILPIIGVVDKSSGYGDYYTGATNSTIFQNTIPRTIQNITTSIVEPDGTPSRVDDGSVVIYKITKQIKNNNVVLQNILNPPKK
jgi:hypothetical protein